MRIMSRPSLLLLCGFALLLAAGCANRTPKRVIDPIVLGQILARAMKPGDVILHDAGTIVMGPRTAEELVSGIEKQFADNSQQDLEGVLRKLQETRNLEEWTLPVATRFAVKAEKLPQLCDSYVRNFVLLRLRGLPRKLKKIQLDAQRESGEAVGTCSFKVIKGGIISNQTGERVRFSGKLFFLDLGSHGRVLLGMMLKARQLELQKPVQEFLLIVPEDKGDSLNLSHIVDAAAKQLYEKIGREWTVVFTLATRKGTGNGFRTLGLRRNALPMANGDIMQLESLKVRIGRSGPVGSALSPAETHVVLEVANKALAQHMKAGTLKEYRDGDFKRDSRAFLDAAGKYAADTMGIGKVTIISSVGEIGEKGQVKLSIPAVFAKRGSEWVFIPPKKTLLPNNPEDNSRPSI